MSLSSLVDAVSLEQTRVEAIGFKVVELVLLDATPCNIRIGMLEQKSEALKTTTSREP